MVKLARAIRTCWAVGCLAIIGSTAQARERWTVAEANAWYARMPWLVGCNFNPSTAINQLEMWQADTFDPDAIDRELGWAADLGFTSMRVFLHNLPYQEDRQGFLERMERFLSIAEKHDIGVMFVLFDGVWDPNPVSGKQRAPEPHLHNSGWVQAPGAKILGDPSRHDELAPYVQGVVTRFRDDPRVHCWDLFNEPDNANTNSYGSRGRKAEISNKAQMATLLLEKTFRWARAADPSQPLTAGVWGGFSVNEEERSSIEKLMLGESDVISFHSYEKLPRVEQRVEQLRRFERPILCTEYMARPAGSRFDPVLGYFKKEKIGAYNWGFVAGKTQTQYPWDSWSRRYTAEPKEWFHEILRPDGAPYDTAEVEYIKALTGKK